MSTPSIAPYEAFKAYIVQTHPQKSYEGFLKDMREQHEKRAEKIKGANIKQRQQVKEGEGIQEVEVGHDVAELIVSGYVDEFIENYAKENVMSADEKERLHQTLYTRIMEEVGMVKARGPRTEALYDVTTTQPVTRRAGPAEEPVKPVTGARPAEEPVVRARSAEEPKRKWEHIYTHFYNAFKDKEALQGFLKEKDAKKVQHMGTWLDNFLKQNPLDKKDRKQILEYLQMRSQAVHLGHALHFPSPKEDKAMAQQRELKAREEAEHQRAHDRAAQQARAEGEKKEKQEQQEAIKALRQKKNISEDIITLLTKKGLTEVVFQTYLQEWIKNYEDEDKIAIVKLIAQKNYEDAIKAIYTVQNAQQKGSVTIAGIINTSLAGIRIHGPDLIKRNAIVEVLEERCKPAAVHRPGSK